MRLSIVNRLKRLALPVAVRRRLGLAEVVPQPVSRHIWSEKELMSLQGMIDMPRNEAIRLLGEFDSGRRVFTGYECIDRSQKLDSQP